MTEYLAAMLTKEYEVGIISRGYKRKTKGFAIANENSTALDIGDEPMQFHKKFPKVTVAVGEERVVAISQLLHECPGMDVILLDDAFQHRQVEAGLNILLTEQQNLYTHDFILPAGDLRDVAASSKRADIILVTKCKDNLSSESRKKITRDLKPEKNQSVFFTAMQYGLPYAFSNRETIVLTAAEDVLLVCGIANPNPLKEYLSAQVHSFDMLRYADHHIFTTDDLSEIKDYYNTMAGGKGIIITTEKDAVRLEKFKNELQDLPLYVLPIRHRFLFGDEEAFASAIFSFIKPFIGNKPKQDVAELPSK